jgi:hypothetical protein
MSILGNSGKDTAFRALTEQQGRMTAKPLRLHERWLATDTRPNSLVQAMPHYHVTLERWPECQSQVTLATQG